MLERGAGGAVSVPRPAAAVDLTMYYPVAVGGPVTKIIDDMVDRFEKENPDIKVTAVYAGNYTDTMTKAMTAMKGGQPPQLSVLLSTDVFTLMDENAIVPMDELVADKCVVQGILSGVHGQRPGRRQDLEHSVPALDHRAVLEQGRVQGSRTRS